MPPSLSLSLPPGLGLSLSARGGEGRRGEENGADPQVPPLLLCQREERGRGPAAAGVPRSGAAGLGKGCQRRVRDPGDGTGARVNVS